jgi:hypothetical protein
VEAGEGWVRRLYSLGDIRISVTVSDMGHAAMSMQRWNDESRVYPQIVLDLPVRDGTGFYDCTGDAGAGECSAHIHLLAGYHVEVLGRGASREHVDAIIAGLDLRALAARSR